MLVTGELTEVEIKHPINLTSSDFNLNKYAYYKWLREEAPVYKGKMSLLNVYFISRYEDCVNILKDPRIIRNRSRATGGGRLPIPIPKSLVPLVQSMILEDEPEHRRLRNLVHKAFTPRNIAKLGKRIENITHELLDKAETKGQVELKEAYALPIPVTVISEMVGVPDEDMSKFSGGMKILTNGLSGWSLLRTIFWDLRGLNKYVRELIAQKRREPQDDILSALIAAEDEGQKLTEDELVSMVFLLVMAGYETTVHLIANSVVTLLQHPEQLERLRSHPELMESAVEEVLRYNGPIQSTKPNYALEDVTLHGVIIPKGSMVMPLCGAANHDPAVFENPEVFDIARSPNRHLGFGHGIHYCLGAPLARLETKIALTNLLERSPNLRLAVAPEEINIQQMPLWHRYERVPIMLG